MKPNKANIKRVLIALAIAAVMMLSVSMCQSIDIANANALVELTGLQPMSLTLVARNGSQLTLQADDIAALSSYEAQGAYKKKTGTIVGPDKYTGVALNTLCDLVGSMEEDNMLWIISSDGYTMSYTYAQVNGDFVTYDPSTGNPAVHNDSIVPILAYFKNDANISLSEGPLRLAIVGPEGLATDGQYWSKSVVRLEIRWHDDVAVTNVAPARTVVEHGKACQINVTLENQGDYIETFDVTVYANASAVGTYSGYTLASGASAILSFTWNTSDFAYGSFVMSAEAAVVPYETDKTDNAYTGATVAVTVRGDVNGDLKVDMLDVTRITGIYGFKADNPEFDVNCDMDYDCEITILDAVTCASHYGETP